MTVSIITVVYNAAESLKKTVKSIQSQTHQDIEYIVVDGKSTDGTLQVIEQHAATITKFISEKDQGIYDAMNKGLALATGELVLFMNAGDLFYNSTTLADSLQGYIDEDVLYGDAAIMNTSGLAYKLRDHKCPPRQLTWRSLQRGMVVCHQSLLVRRSIAPFYELRYKIAADIDWTIRLLKQSTRVKNTHLVVCKFLEGGTSSQRRNRSWLERWKILQQHYGIVLTSINHLGFLLEALLIKPFRKPVAPPPNGRMPSDKM